MRIKLLLITCFLLVSAFGVQSVLAQNGYTYQLPPDAYPSFVPPPNYSTTNWDVIIILIIIAVAVVIIVAARIKLRSKNAQKVQ